MCTYNNEIIEIKLEDLVPFSFQIPQTYQGERLKQLMDSIERVGLMNPIIVRSIAENGKYEILCGHNRVKAMKELGYNVIQADVRYGVSDDKARELFYESNLNQQSFLDWNYTKKIDMVKYAENLIKASSQQGKRNDLNKNELENSKEITSVYNRQKLSDKTKKETTRDKMARRLGISTATLSKYRSIIKLPDNLIQCIARLLDQKRISFEVAYLISRLDISKIEILIQSIDDEPNKEVDKNELKKFCTSNKNPKVFQPKVADYRINEVLKPKAGSGIFKPITNRG